MSLSPVDSPGACDRCSPGNGVRVGGGEGEARGEDSGSGPVGLEMNLGGRSGRRALTSMVQGLAWG